MPKSTARKQRQSGGHHPIDVHVGKRLRMRRTLLGMSQGKLSDAIGVTFQQVQKYERGANRVSASRLYELSSTLQVPVTFFFDEYDTKPPKMTDDPDPMFRRETLELVRDYYAIVEPSIRQRVRELVKVCTGKRPEHS